MFLKSVNLVISEWKKEFLKLTDLGKSGHMKDVSWTLDFSEM